MPTGAQKSQVQMPRYRCHKEVHALKIKDISGVPGLHALIPEDKKYAPIPMTEDWFRKHAPNAPGYLVVYTDGYRSWSPVEAFESGYTLIS